MDKVVDTIAKYGIKLKEVLNGRRGRVNEVRKVGMCLARRCHMTLKEVAETFVPSYYGTIGWACH